jgi:trans-aconitate methyltransferase
VTKVTGLNSFQLELCFMNTSNKNHWETIYTTKQPHEVSWTQETPSISLELIESMKIPTSASIIDVGGGDSKLVDVLLEKGFTDITVLDISAAAIERAKTRLGAKANLVNWVVSDILEFKTNKRFDVWHDRAAFHFQTEETSIQQYIELVKNLAADKIIVGTFSVDGPKKCSGLEVKQYEEKTMKFLFEDNNFKNLECKREDHITPSGNIQNFVFCSFQNLAA